MSGDQATAAGVPTGRRYRLAAVVLGFWLLAACIQVVMVWQTDAPVLGYNDDHMRLAQVADLQRGQGWYDLTQYRLFPPEGTAMHWTRHVDTLVGGLILAFGGPSDGAERASLIVLPLLLLLAVFGAVALIARRLAGAPGVPLALLVLLASVLTASQFGPGRIDHHGLQIVLVLVAVAGLLRLEEPRWSIAAGVAAGVSLSVGLEPLVSIVALVLSFGLVAIGPGRAAAPPVWRFSVSLVAAAATSALIFAPPGRLLDRDCDVLSLPYWIFFVLLSGVVAIAPLLGTSARRDRRLRLAFVIGSAAAAGAIALAVAPQCASGPYAAVDPLLKDLWLHNVAEARSLWVLLHQDPGLAAAIVVPGAVAMLYAASQACRSRRLDGVWTRLLPVLVLSYAVAFVQIRGAALATALSAAILGVLVLRVRERLMQRPMLLRVLVLFTLVLTVSGLGWIVGGAMLDGESDGNGWEDCIREVVLLDQLQPTVIAAPINLGPSIIAFTDQAVLAAPYHRNNEGNLAAWGLFLAPPAETAERLEAAGATTVVICRELPETGILTDLAPDGLMAALLDNDIPASLDEIDLGAESLRVFRLSGR